MTVVNLTPHKIVVETAAGRVEFAPSGQVARITSRPEVAGEIDGIPVTRTIFGPVEGLPEPQAGVTFVVSSLVAGRVPNRPDVVAPDTGPTAIRVNGQIVAVRGFQRF